MDTSNNIGIWISSEENIAQIPDILQKLDSVPDLFIITPLEIANDQYMIVSPYHVMFHDCTIIFLSIHDLLEYKHLLKTQKIILCVKDDSHAQFLNSEIKQSIRVVYI